MSLADLWFVLFVAIIAGYLVLDGFDLGVGMLHPFAAREDRERRIVLNSIGPIWDGNEVWLVVGGGVLFAAFPVVYAALFSGLYWALMLVLICLILRLVTDSIVKRKCSNSIFSCNSGMSPFISRINPARVSASPLTSSKTSCSQPTASQNWSRRVFPSKRNFLSLSRV